MIHAERIADEATHLASSDIICPDVVAHLCVIFYAAMEIGSPWRRALEAATWLQRTGVEVVPGHVEIVLRNCGVLGWCEGQTQLEDIEGWVRVALVTRVALDRAAFRTVNTEALGALARCDEVLAGLSEAVLVLDEDEYRDLLDGADPPPGAWWGLRRELDRRVPETDFVEAVDRP